MSGVSQAGTAAAANSGDKPDSWLELRWGAAPGTGSEKIWECKKAEDWFGNGMLYSMERTFLALLGFKDFTQPCPYIPTVNAIELIKLKSGEATDEPCPCPSLVHRCLQDRIVFYGADILAAADQVETPVNGRLPGVYVHAMAVDNILTFGLLDETKVASIGFIGSLKTYVNFAFLYSFCLLGTLTGHGMRMAAARITAFQHALLDRIGVLLAIPLAIVIAVIASFLMALVLMSIIRLSYFGFHLPPIDWLGLQLLIGTGMAFDLLGITDWLKKSPGDLEVATSTDETN